MQVFEEDLARAVMSEKLLLQRALRPIGKGGALQLQHAFVQKRDQGEDGKLDHLTAVTQTLGLLHRGLQSRPHVVTKYLRLLYGLLPRTQPEDGGKGVFVAGSQAVSTQCEIIHASVPWRMDSI